MKKFYVTFSLNKVTFDKADVIRTSVGTADTAVETDVNYETYFGGITQ